MSESERSLTNIPGLQPGEVVVIKKFGYASVNQIRSKSVITRVDPSTKKEEIIMDIGQYSKWTLVYGIKQANFFIGCLTVNDRASKYDEDVIPAETGDYLLAKIKEFNGLEKADELKKE
jgi:hypothetical protein